MSDAYLERLVALRGEAWQRQKTLLDEIAARDGIPTAEERENIEQTDTVLSRYKKDEEEHLARVKLSEGLSEWRERVAPKVRTTRTEDPTDKDFIRALVDGTLSNELKTSDGFAADPSMPFRRGWSGNGHEDSSRALAIAAGTTVPQTFADFVVVYERTLNPTYDLATVIRTSSGEPFTIPRVTADPSASGGTIVAEAGTIPTADPTISQLTLGSFKLANITLWSAELAQDNYVGIDNLVAESVARDLSVSWGAFFTTGTGTVQPKGFIAAGSNGGTANGTAAGVATDTFIAPADVIDLFFSLAAPYRKRGSWQASNTGFAKVRKFRDSTGQLMYDTAQAAGNPDLLLGRPIYENPAMAAVASASKSIAFGDFSRYYVREVVPMRVDLSKEYAYATDQLALRVITRRDGNLPDVAAIKYLVSANT